MKTTEEPFENISRSKFEHLGRYYIAGEHCCFCAGIGLTFTSGRGQVRAERAAKFFLLQRTHDVVVQARILNMQQLW